MASKEGSGKEHWRNASRGVAGVAFTTRGLRDVCLTRFTAVPPPQNHIVRRGEGRGSA